MSGNYFSGNVFVQHRARQLFNQDLSYQRLQLNEGDNYSVLDFVTAQDEFGIINARFPLEAVITSAPLLLNFESFPNQNPNHFVKTFKPFVDPLVTAVSEALGIGADRSNYQIEFRTSDEQSMSSASEWNSVKNSSYLASNYNIFDLLNNYNYPKETGDLIVTQIVSGLNINATSSNSIGNVAYIELKDGVSGLNQMSNTYGTYLAADFTASRAGAMLEWVVIHESSDNDDIFNVEPPYKHVISIDSAGKEQSVVWDITDFPIRSNRADNFSAIGWKVLEGRYGDVSFDIKKLRLFSLSRDNAGGIMSGVPFPATAPARYIQYRLTASRATAFDDLYISGIQFSTNVAKTVLPSSLMRHNKYVNLGAVNYPERSGLRIIY